MRLYITFLFLFLSAVATHAQQNLFNIPSADITPKGKFFYQHQLNTYSNKIESKSHLVYGLGGGWDAGINLVGKGIKKSPYWSGVYNSDPAKGALSPTLLGTLQKQITLSEKLKWNTGIQAGPNLTNVLNQWKANYFLYSILAFEPKKGIRFIGGAYHTNANYVGEGPRNGVLLGYEAKLNKHWYLMGDWISGSNESGVAVIGGMYVLNKRIQLCAGYQIANPNSPKPNAVVLELNWLGWNYY